jgi:4-alpha-glucanotransferase
MKRSSGVLMPISALNGEYSCGSFGKEAKAFVDLLCEGGFKYWQVLPFCVVDECNSPYKSYSAFGGNPYFVDLPTLAAKGLVTPDELEKYRQQNQYSCEYGRLYHTRFELLKAASARVKDRSKVEAFISSNEKIEQFCRFMALKSANNGALWVEWECDEIDDDELFAWQFIQYEFFEQWKDIKAYANSRGVSIIGDVPIYVSYDSCDVWANKELFQLDGDYRPRCVAGVPPDYFSEDGQLWGNPIYDWERMKEDGFAWWKSRLAHMFKLFDGVRIDHFRGIDTYWSIPGDAVSAKQGEWKKGPGRELIDALKGVSDGKLLIAEDLGEESPSVTELLKYSGFPGMRVMQFGFLGEDDNTHLPHNYIENCIAYTGTHDNNTLLGYVWEIAEDKRRYLMEYCGYDSEDWDKCYDSIIRTLFASSAGIAVLPIQDLLGYGSDTRFNIPGKPDGNWCYRVTQEQLNSIDWGKFRRLNSLYKR